MSNPMPMSLNDWLHKLENGVTDGVIDLGLERIGRVKDAMDLVPSCPVIIVAGTNGKGSVCAFLTAILQNAGWRVGTLTSPHLLHFNERICINQNPVADAAIVQAFEKIEAARQDTMLTYFEFNTLAAVSCFIKEKVDVMVLEVGLGGRLDAINIFDADVAVIVSIDLDHQNYLGDNIEAIAREKAGILRRNRWAILGEDTPPILTEIAQKKGAYIARAHQDFGWQLLDQKQWSFATHCPKVQKRHALPLPALRGSYQIHNAACALAALACLADVLPIDNGACRQGLLQAQIRGRFQVLPGRPLVVLDVAHNPHAARAMAANIMRLPFAKRKIAVFSILKDKDIDGVLSATAKLFNQWYIAPLPVERACPIDKIQQALHRQNISDDNILLFNDIHSAYDAAYASLAEDDLLMVFGSFHTVAATAAIVGN